MIRARDRISDGLAEPVTLRALLATDGGVPEQDVDFLGVRELRRPLYGLDALFRLLGPVEDADCLVPLFKVVGLGREKAQGLLDDLCRILVEAETLEDHGQAPEPVERTFHGGHLLQAHGGSNECFTAGISCRRMA